MNQTWLVAVAASLAILSLMAPPVYIVSYISAQRDDNDTPTISKISPKWRVDQLDDPFSVITDMAFHPQDGRIFLVERHGCLKVFDEKKQGAERVKLLGTLDKAYESGTTGLMSLDFHPEFTKNSLIYLYYTYKPRGDNHTKVVQTNVDCEGRTNLGNPHADAYGIYHRVSQFRLNGEKLDLNSEKIIVDKIPGGFKRNAGRMRFGPDSKLYITTGDGAIPNDKQGGKLAQEDGSLAGKMLRVNPDGSVPADNPKGSLVYAKGLRNSQGFDWHPHNGALLATDHGQSAHDEINEIQRDGNHGWPNKECSPGNTRDGVPRAAGNPKKEDPIFCSGNQTWAPSGMAAMEQYGVDNSGPALAPYHCSFVVASLLGHQLVRFEYDDQGNATQWEVLLEYDKNKLVGRLRAVLVDKQGNIYVSQSNFDQAAGKDGNAKNLDRRPNHIVKLTPK